MNKRLRFIPISQSARDRASAEKYSGSVSADGRFHQLTAFDASGGASVEYRVDPSGNVRRVSPQGLPSASVTAWSRGFRHAVGTSCDATHCAAFRWDAKRGARFLPHLDAIPTRDGSDTFGAMVDADESGTQLTYLCGVAVKEFPARLGSLTKLELAARTYAVWAHREHVSLVAHTCQQIFEHGLADAGLTPEPAPMFERYGAAFDGRTGNGGFEVWVPVKG